MIALSRNFDPAERHEIRMRAIFEAGKLDPRTFDEDTLAPCALRIAPSAWSTLADLAGLPLPKHLEGISFKPVLENPDRPWKQAAFSQYPRPGGKSGSGQLMGYSMRTERHRFTVWVARNDASKVEAIELYDHSTDPQENQNLAGRKENAALVEKLMVQWKAGWRGALPKS